VSTSWIWNERGADSYRATDAVCRCPYKGCGEVWSHREAGSDGVMVREALARYSGPRQCPACGQWSTVKPGGWFVGPRRIPCPPPREADKEAAPDEHTR
jgi:hypothetical protein